MIEAHDLARSAAQAIADKQGSDVVALEVGPIIAITEVFVLADGANVRQVRTIIDEIEHCLAAEHDRKPRSREGRDDASWVLLDYGDIVVHVFLTETRDYYGLDRLWADAPRLELDLEAPSAAPTGS